MSLGAKVLFSRAHYLKLKSHPGHPVVVSGPALGLIPATPRRLRQPRSRPSHVDAPPVDGYAGLLEAPRVGAAVCGGYAKPSSPHS